MTFSPVRKSKHNGIKTECARGHKHDSRREARRCEVLHQMQDAELIAALKVHPFFPFVINGETPKMRNGHKLGVTLDFSYVEVEAAQFVAEDVKGRSRLADSRDWPLRRTLFEHIYKAWDLREVRS